ncbi:MAG: hypothetical protein HC837_01915 [Chloroflexaceae bacterium]|nr:hypothetical protein [Chloroflexaceae bacterium]
MAGIRTESGDPQEYTLFVSAKRQNSSNQPDDSGWETREARIELLQSHALLNVGKLLRAFDSQLTHTHFNGANNDGVLVEEYVNERYRVTYCLRDQGYDELCVRWRDTTLPQTYAAVVDLLTMALNLAHALGGGTNLRLVKSAAMA